MQCSSCEFENMPGIQSCGRCGSPLGLKDLAIDVQPPRASDWQKRARGWLPTLLGRPRYKRGLHAGPRQRRKQKSSDRIEPLTWGLVLRLVLPGWAHHYLDERSLARIFLSAYLPLLLTALLLPGTFLGSVSLGLAFAAHVACTLSAVRIARRYPGPLRIGGEPIQQILQQTGVIFLALLIAIYLPAGWLYTRVALPVTVQMDTPPFQVDDVILTSPALDWLRAPRPGDVVLYHQRYMTYIPGGPRHVAVRVDSGARIDRILAGAGDAVSFEDGVILVNGTPSPWKPLNPENVMRKGSLKLTVPAGHYWILPTTQPLPLNIPEDVLPQLLHDLTLVRAADIQGRAYLQSYPLSRLRWLN